MAVLILVDVPVVCEMVWKGRVSVVLIELIEVVRVTWKGEAGARGHCWRVDGLALGPLDKCATPRNHSPTTPRQSVSPLHCCGAVPPLVGR